MFYLATAYQLKIIHANTEVIRVGKAPHSLPIICPAGVSELKISCPISAHDSWALTHGSPGDELPGW